MQPEMVGNRNDVSLSPQAGGRSCAAAEFPQNRKRILVIDPSEMTRECVRHMLATHFADVDAVARPPSRAAADLVLLHIGHARTDTRKVASEIAEMRARLGPDVPLAVLAERDDPELAIAAIRLGLRGYLATSLSVDMAIAAVALIVAGGSFIPAEALFRQCAAKTPVADDRAAGPPEPPEARSTGPNLCNFTDRETEVLLALQRGSPNKIIAYQLNIAESTVKVHVRNILKKLRANSQEI
jgi:DNA-binding NarL/FixJ family response regulator